MKEDGNEEEGETHPSIFLLERKRRLLRRHIAQLLRAAFPSSFSLPRELSPRREVGVVGHFAHPVLGKVKLYTVQSPPCVDAQPLHVL